LEHWTLNILNVDGSFKFNIMIGVLDIQGSVIEHFEALKKARFKALLVKNIKDLEQVDALIMPGGESTAIGKLLDWFGLGDEIIKRVKAGMPIYGTCAGAILMAKEIIGKQKAKNLQLMDISIERNAYGRQLDSFETEIEFDFNDKLIEIPAVFIRAPRIAKVGEKTKVLAKYNGEIVAAREGNMLVSTFHPEMTDDPSIYKYFTGMIKS